MSEAFPLDREEQGFPRAVHAERRAQEGQKVASGGGGQTACRVGSSSPRILLETAAVLGTCEERGGPL